MPETSAHAIAAFKVIVDNIKKEKEEFDKFGKLALDKKLRNPRDIFWDIHTGKKLAKRIELPAHREKLEKEKLEKAKAAGEVKKEAQKK